MCAARKIEKLLRKPDGDSFVDRTHRRLLREYGGYSFLEGEFRAVMDLLSGLNPEADVRGSWKEAMKLCRTYEPASLGLLASSYSEHFYEQAPHGIREDWFNMRLDAHSGEFEKRFLPIEQKIQDLSSSGADGVRSAWEKDTCDLAGRRLTPKQILAYVDIDLGPPERALIFAEAERRVRVPREFVDTITESAVSFLRVQRDLSSYDVDSEEMIDVGPVVPKDNNVIPLRSKPEETYPEQREGRLSEAEREVQRLREKLHEFEHVAGIVAAYGKLAPRDQGAVLAGCRALLMEKYRAMETVTVDDFGNSKALLKRIKDGGSAKITKHGRPFATLRHPPDDVAGIPTLKSSKLHSERWWHDELMGGEVRYVVTSYGKAMALLESIPEEIQRVLIEDEDF